MSVRRDDPAAQAGGAAERWTGPEVELATVTAADGRALLAAAERDWARPVAHCPGWDAATLVGHMGTIVAWMATVVTTGAPIARADREKPPSDTAELGPWFTARSQRALDVLLSTPAHTAVWTFSPLGVGNVGWWRRRLAVEMAIHRRDAQHAAGVEADPLDVAVAVAGIEEFVTEFLPGLLARDTSAAVGGSLRLEATDGPVWWVDLDARGGALAEPVAHPADTVVRAGSSELLLWLTNRASEGAVQVVGATGLAAAWPELRR